MKVVPDITPSINGVRLLDFLTKIFLAKKKSRSLTPLILTPLIFLLLANVAQADDDYFKVTVAEPFIELHTGPGRGHPVFHVVERGKTVEVLKRQTSWYKVRTSKGKEGWVSREQFEKTLTDSGVLIQVTEVNLDDFANRRWEAGVMGGDLEGARSISTYAGFHFTENISAEIAYTEALGSFSESKYAVLSLVHTPFPDWWVSPYFSLGAGQMETIPRANLVQSGAEARKDDLVAAGVGVKVYLASRFMFRVEYKNYVVQTTRDDNEELEEWRAGFSFFF